MSLPAAVEPAARRPERPALRLVPEPGTEPLRLRRSPAVEPPRWEPPVATGRLRALPAPAHVQEQFPLRAAARPIWPVPTLGDEVITPSDQLPCPAALAHRLVQAAVDVVRGLRPATQVLRWTTPEVYSQLRQRARAELQDPRVAGRRPVVRSVRTCRNGASGVEVAAVVLDGGRARAVAVRLDGVDGRWRMTALEMG